MSNKKVRSLKDVISSEETDILNEPTKLFHPVRILIMKTLALHGQADFRELKYSLKLTDGRLASNMKTLVDMGYVIMHKEVINKKMRTSFELTEEGLLAFNHFISKLEKVIENWRNEESYIAT